MVRASGESLRRVLRGEPWRPAHETAHEASRVVTESARLVRMTRHRHEPARCRPRRPRVERDFASVFARLEIGATSTFARPATGDLIPLMLAASG